MSARNAGTTLKLVVVGAVVLAAYWMGLSHRGPLTEVADDADATIEPGYAGFSPLEINLGRHPWYTEVPFAARFVNNGPDAVSVATVKSSCGCTMLERDSYAEVVVEPGSELELRGTLDVSGTPGVHREKLQLLLASGSIHPVFLKYVAYRTYDFKPRSLRFGQVDLDDPTDDAIASVIFSSQTATVVGEPVTDSAWLEAAVDDRGTGEAEIVVRLVKRNLPYGKNVGRVSVATDDPTRGNFGIPVQAEGVAYLRPVPSHLFIRPGGRRTARFITKEGHTARIASVVSDNQFVETSIDANRTAISVRLTAETLTNAAVLSVTDEDGHRSKLLVSCVR